jgi:hypothetical protein
MSVLTDEQREQQIRARLAAMGRKHLLTPSEEVEFADGWWLLSLLDAERARADAAEAKMAAVRRMADAPHVYVLSTDDVLDAIDKTCQHGRAACLAASCT